MIEIFTLLERRDITQLARSSAMRDACIHEGAYLALSSFLFESEYGSEAPPLSVVGQDATIPLGTIAPDGTDRRIEALVGDASFTYDDVLSSAIKHMIAGDMRVLHEQTAQEVAAARAERAQLYEEVIRLMGDVSVRGE